MKWPIISLMLAAVLGGTHGIAAVGAAHLSGKEADRPHIKGLGAGRDQCLDAIPQFAVYDRFMSALHTIPLLLGTGLVFLGFIRNTAVFSLYHIPNVDFVGEHMRDGRVFPKRAVFTLRLLIAQAM